MYVYTHFEFIFVMFYNLTSSPVCLFLHLVRLGIQQTIPAVNILVKDSP